ncbi:protein FAM81B-like [Orussus abietinus]|uniref:protein FAM81B-like n=1 Tax=Orussus abietinus TaxID=222816 RepID=UPI0006265D74|nr:protein FAM81B-like [Orussus abietinus]
MIQSHHSNFITDILKITCNWENTNVYDCGKILEEKLKENSRQHDEIRKEVYDLRLHEIRNHNTCLKQHKLGIHIELQALTVNLEKFLLQEKSNSTDYMKDLVDLENLINEIQTFAKIKHLQNKINRRFNECEKMLQDSISTYQDSFNSKISYLHDKNNTFLQTIK